MSEFQIGFVTGVAVGSAVLALTGILAAAYLGRQMRQGTEGQRWQPERRLL